MTITITDNRITISEADSTTGWTGTESLVLTTSEPTPVESTACLGMQVGVETDYLYYTTAAINMSAGVLVYVWVNDSAVPDTLQNGGIMLLLGDGTNRTAFHVAGSDVAGFRHSEGPVAWQCLVIDTGELPTQYYTDQAGSFGSLNLAAITQIGAGFKHLTKAKGANCFIDVIRYGNGGLVITGGDPSDPVTFEQIAAADRGIGDLEAYGVFRELGSGLFGSQGPITIGTTGSTSTFFKDSNVSVVFEDRFIGADKYGITIWGNSTAGTHFELGTKQGTGDDVVGSAGVSFTVPKTTLNASIGDPSASFVVSASNEASQSVFIYGSTFTGFSAGLSMSAAIPTGSDHEFVGNVVANCGPVDLQSAFVRNSTFSDYSFVSGAAVVWNSNINIKNSAFIGNTFAIQHLETGLFTYDNLQFSADIYDVLNESAGPVTASIVGGGSTPTYFNSGSSTTKISADVSVTLTGMVSQSEVIVLDSDTGSEIAHVEDVGATGNWVFIDSAGNTVDIFIHAIDYVWESVVGYIIPSVDTNLPVQQTFDRNYENPT